MNSNQNKNLTTNNSAEIGNQSGNMYSYHDDDMTQNPPHESNAIRRSIGEGNPSLNPMINNINDVNNIPTMTPTTPYLDQFPSTNVEPKNIIEGKNKNLPGYPNYIDNRSSEQRIPNLQDNRAPYRMYPPEQPQFQNPVYHPQPRESKKFYLINFIIIGLYHIIMIILIATCFKYSSDLNKNNNLYNFFKDVHLMIFIGFGLLYTMLKDHQWSSVAIVLFIGVISIESSFFWYYLWTHTFENDKWEKIEIDYNVLCSIDYISITVIITLGALIGKLSIIQYFYLSIVETFVASLNYFICDKKVKAIDFGGSVYFFTFGTIFGIIVSIILFCRETEYTKISNNPHLNSDYYSNIFSFIGTLFLWLFFPSFNTANIPSNIESFRYRGIINTYLSMIGSLISTFIVSPLIYNGKLKIEHLLNASYVGGVIISGCCTICSEGWASILIGCIGGTISILCLWKLKSIFKNNKLEDTLGILHIFGIPGVLGGFLNSIFIGNFSNQNAWGEQITISDIFEDIKSPPSKQAGLQVAIILITVSIAAMSGIVSGFCLTILGCEKNEIYFVDSELFYEDENIPLPEWKYPRQNDINLSSSGNKLDEQGREVNIEQEP